MVIQSSNKEERKILLFEGVHPSAVEEFQKNGYGNIESLDHALQGQELIEKIKTAHVIGVRSRTQLHSKALQAATNLMAIGCFCVGVDQVDLKTATCKGLPVFNAPLSNTRSVAEFVIGLAIMLFRDIFPKNAAAHRGIWLKDAKK